MNSDDHRKIRDFPLRPLRDVLCGPVSTGIAVSVLIKCVINTIILEIKLLLLLNKTSFFTCIPGTDFKAIASQSLFSETPNFLPVTLLIDLPVLQH